MNHVDHLVDDYLHDLLAPAERQRVADHVLECAACWQALDQSRKRLAALQSVPPTEATPELVASTLERVETEPVLRAHVWRSRLVATLAMMAACVILLLGTQFYYASLQANPVDLVVLGQRDLLADAKTSLRIRLHDRRANQPLAATPVRVELVAADGVAKSLATFQTDAGGLGQPVFTVPDLPEGNYRLRVTAETSTRPEVIERDVRVRRSWQVMLSTDKPLYQPGQTIHLRALSLRRPLLLPMANQEAIFTLIDSRGNVLFKEVRPTSAYGLASVDCPLAGELTEGTYTVRCKIGDSESNQSVPIRKYVLPKFAIDLKWDRPFYEPGEPLIGTVRVLYTTGKPVVKGQVIVTGPSITCEPVTTDAEGNATVKVRSTGGEGRHGLACKVVDSAGQSNERLSEVLVTRRPYRIELLPENGTLVAGVENVIHVVSTRADGKPISVRLAITGRLDELTTDANGIAELRLTPRQGETLRYRATDDNGRVLDQGERSFSVGPPSNDFLIRSDRAVYQGGQTMKLTVHGGGNEPVFVDLVREGRERYTLRSETIRVVEGKGELEIDLNPDLMGTLSLLAYRFAHDGLAIQKTRLVQVLPAGQLTIQVEADRKEYRPRGEATLKFRLLGVDGKPRVGALSLAGVDEAVYAMLPIKPGSEGEYFTLEPGVLETVTSRYPWRPVRMPTPEVQARDQAVFSVSARMATRTAAPQSAIREPDPDGDEMPQVRPQPSPSSLGLLSLEATSFREKVQQLSQLQTAAGRWLMWGWVILGLIAAGVAYGCLWVFMPLREALALHAGIGLIVLPLAAVLVLSPLGERFASFDQVSSSVAGRAENRFRTAENLFLFDGTESMDVGDGRPRVRDYFPETLLWRPELVTDEKGEATLTVPLADSITTWRISASAVDLQGQLGAETLALRVFQPFFVDFNLPVSLTRNDQVSIPVIVSSYLDRPQSVKLTLKADDWYELLEGQTEQMVEIQPGEVKAVTYRIAVRKAGLRQLEVMAQAGAVGDAIRRPIEVLPDGRPVDLTASGSLETPYAAPLTLPDNVIEGSGKLLLKVYPSRFSQVVEGLDTIFRMPYGCFEQTSSTTYPNILALDYLQQTRQDRPEIAAKAKRYIALGYQRLVGFEVSGGGFEWFGQTPANVALTAYGLMEFEDMARVYAVDPALINRTRSWLLRQRRGDGSWPSDLRMLRGGATDTDLTLSTTAYVAWSVFANGRAAGSIGETRAYLKATRPDAIGNVHTLALVANALLAIDPTGDNAAPYLKRLAQQATDGPDGQAFWALNPNQQTTFHGAGEAGNIEVTALATLALLQGKKSPETTRRALAWLVSKKDRNGTWHSTQATVLSLRALLVAAGNEAETPKDRQILVRLGEHRQEIMVPKEKAEVMQMIDLSAHLKPGKQTLEVSEPSKTGAGFQVTYRYHVPGERINPGGLALAVEYGATELTAGESLRATARIRNSPEQAAAMLLVELPIPAGFRVHSEDFAQLVERKIVARYQVEGTRVLVYLREMARDARLELPYRLDAVQPVETLTQPGRVYEYYDPAREAFSTPVRLRVAGR